MSIPISNGTGASSVAAEAVGGLQYQQIEVYGRGAASVLGINPDGSINASVIGTPNVNITGSVIAVNQNSSVIAIVTGSVTALQGTTPWLIGSVYGNVSGSVVAFQGTVPWTIGSVYGNISGSVAAFQAGTRISSVQSITPSSMLVGASIFGQLPAGTAPLGSVATLQGTNPWVSTNVGSIITTNVGSVITVLQSSSIIAINAGSVVAVSQGSVITVLQSPSIVGTYAEDIAFTQNDKGIYVLGVRNDTLASVTSADLDYSQMTVGPVGEMIVAQAPITKWVQGTADLRVVLGASVTAIAAQGASIFTYIQAAQVANFGSASVIVTFGGGLGSILGYTIAPAGGGSNIIFKPALKTGANSAFTASINGTASVLVSAQGFVAKV